MKNRIRHFLSNRPLLQALRRKLLQIAAFGFINADVGNFAKGVIGKGEWKSFCAPGMNCYSCPAARFACPIGAMQAVNGSMDFGFSFYAVGFLLAAGVLAGRFLCGFLCPFGLLQELLHKIPSPKKHLPRPFTWLKYVFLVVFVFLLPVLITDFVGSGEPAYCQYICPVGTLEAGIPLMVADPPLRQLAGPLFILKAVILAAVLVGCVFVSRFFCKIGCPMGAFLGLLNRLSAYHLEVDDEKCTHCHRCAHACPMDVDPVCTPNSSECIRCGRCSAVCPHRAIRFRFGYSRNSRRTSPLKKNRAFFRKT